MPTTDEAPIDARPGPAGLPQGGDAADPAARSGPDLIDAAAAGKTLGDGEQADLLGYFLTNAGLPGDSTPDLVEFTTGRGEDARTEVWDVRRIDYDEWEDSRKRASDVAAGKFNASLQASWIVARALVRPNLGPAVLRQQEEAKAAADGMIDGPEGQRIRPPTDSAHLLRRMFARQSGVLMDISRQVLVISKLDDESQSAKIVERDVAAGKR